MTTDRLDDAATAFHDNPTETTALRYEAIAIAYCNAMVISPDELENILWLVVNFLETKQGAFA